MTIISGGFRKLTLEEAKKASSELQDAWKDKTIPKTQWELAVKNEIQKYYQGAPCPAFSAFVNCLLQIPTPLDNPDTKILELGASSGYYSEVLRIAGFKMTYEASDYSPAFKEFAKMVYPELKYWTVDARRIPFPDNWYDIVVSGCLILHNLDYPEMIRESARVAKKYVLYHRTPISLNNETEYFQKLAYDVPCLEIHFKEEELMKLFTEAKLRCIHRVQIFSDERSGLAHYSYLFEKMNR